MPIARTAPLFLLLAAVSAAGCREDGLIKVASLEFDGAQQINASALANVLQTKQGSWVPFSKKPAFDRRAFDADLKRIETYYQDRGFPDARVRSFDVDLNDAQDEVRITLHISEGEPVLVAGVDLVGFDVLNERRQRRLLNTLPLQQDQPLDREQAAASRERALNELRRVGYPYAEVQLTDEEVAPRRRQLRLQATAGTLARFGPIEIAGEQSVGEEVIRRQLAFKPGDLFTRDDMRASQRRIYGLELFEFVNVESREDREQQPAEVPVRVTVAEGKHRKLTFGLGYGTEEQARARIRWDHLNFFGGARHGGFEGKWSSLNRGVKLDFREPYFFSPRMSLNFEGQAWQASEPVFSSNQLGGRVTMRYDVTERTYWSVGIINEYQRSTIDREGLEDFDIRDELIALGLDPRDGVSKGTLSALAFDFSHSTTNNPLDARRGYTVTAHAEQAGRWLPGSFNYWSATLEGRHYLSVARRFVVANRLRVGTIDPQGDADANVPFYKRFFLGGATSIRGWGRYEVSPLSGFGFPIGGLSSIEGSSELRFPVWGKLGAVAFLDYGNVWPDARDFRFDDLRYAVGPGLRYLTPIGPARIDLGFQLNPIDNLLVNGEPQKRALRVHFSIGQAF